MERSISRPIMPFSLRSVGVDEEAVVPWCTTRQGMPFSLRSVGVDEEAPLSSGLRRLYMLSVSALSEWMRKPVSFVEFDWFDGLSVSALSEWMRKRILQLESWAG